MYCLFLTIFVMFSLWFIYFMHMEKYSYAYGERYVFVNMMMMNVFIIHVLFFNNIVISTCLYLLTVVLAYRVKLIWIFYNVVYGVIILYGKFYLLNN